MPALHNHKSQHLIVLGAQKAGTTSLYHWLSQSGQFRLAQQKEIQYFSLYYHNSWQWYENQFERPTHDGQYQVDISPYYLFHPYAAERIKKHAPRAKLIALLRDPVSRSLSQYFHAVRLGFESLSLEEAICAENQRLEGAKDILLTPGSTHFSHQKHSYVSRSRYEQQLKHYLRFFKRDQLLIIKSEDLFIKPNQCWRVLQEFLRLDAHTAPGPLPLSNRGEDKSLEVSGRIREKLREELESTYKECGALYGIDWP